VLLGAILETPNLVERLLQVLRPEASAAGTRVQPKNGGGGTSHDVD
jgi:hypothetical protein